MAVRCQHRQTVCIRQARHACAWQDVKALEQWTIVHMLRCALQQRLTALRLLCLGMRCAYSDCEAL